MSLIAGTITVSGVDASYTGTGLALALMDAEVADFALLMTSVNMPAASITAANTLAFKPPRHQRFKAKSEAFAAAIINYLTANGVITVPVAANAIDAGIPSVPRTLTGTIG